MVSGNSSQNKRQLNNDDWAVVFLGVVIGGLLAGWWTAIIGGIVAYSGLEARKKSRDGRDRPTG